MTASRPLQSEYMDFAKYRAGARFNLASSGAPDAVFEDLDVRPEDLRLHGPNAGGYGLLRERIAARFDIPVDCVVTPGGGCSFANHLALAALVEPGDEALVESPGYELLETTLRYLGAQVRRFPRRREAGFALEADEVLSRLTARTRLVVITSPHNPSGAPSLDSEALKIAAALEPQGGRLISDEVYRELSFADARPQTLFGQATNVVVTSSLTKAYGLSGLRCGWILAPAALARRMSRLNDLFGVHAPHISERLALRAFDRLPELRARTLERLGANWSAYLEILGASPRLEQAPHPPATTVFPRVLRAGGGDALAEELRSRFEVSVVPGRFFDASEHVRIGLVGEPAETREALVRTRAALLQP